MTTESTARAPSLEEVRQRAVDMLVDSLQQAGQMLHKAAGFVSALPAPSMPSLRPHAAGCCCEIPETPCPPRCTCTIALAAMTGQPVTAGIRVVNESAETRVFSFTATPFLGGGTTASFVFEPPQLTIGPGEWAFAAATLTVPATFHKGRYACDIIVTGHDEHCVRVTLDVGCDEHQSGTCEVVEHERREHIRAHRWYDHFQCVEPCGSANRTDHD